MNAILKFLFFVFLIFPTILFAQQKKYLLFDDNWEYSNSKYNQIYSCEAYVLESGAYDGPFKCFCIENDTLVKEYHFVNNVLDGKVVEFYKDGSLKLEAEYKKGLPINSWKEWNENGELIVEKLFDENSRIEEDGNNKKISEYEKLYFEIKEFEAPVYSTECITKKNAKEKYQCSDNAMLEYYKHPPLPPSYFEKNKFKDKTLVTKLKYQLSNKGKVYDVLITESCGDKYLDELAQIHVMNMIPFESAKEYGNPIKSWIEADIIFEF